MWKMRKILSLATLLVSFFPTCLLAEDFRGKAPAPEEKWSLWYRQPASLWMRDALPIGNGQFGAMLFGGVRADSLQFNDKTLWSGTRSTYGNYQNFGWLKIWSDSIGSVTYYRRSLSLEDATSVVSFSSGDVDYRRTYIASNPDSVVAVRYEASKGGRINVLISMEGAHADSTVYAGAGGSFEGDITDDSGGYGGMEHYYARFSVVPEGGETSVTAHGLRIRGADAFTLLLRGNSNYDAYSPTYLFDSCLVKPGTDGQIDAAAARPWDELLARHTADYRRLASKCSIDLAGTENDRPTDELVGGYTDSAPSHFLEMLYFRYGRYLLISSARGEDIPCNLQGIWNHRNNPPWSSDMHTDINVEMNYWPCEVTNLSELHGNLLRYLRNESMGHAEWAHYARAAYRELNGFDCPDSTDLGWALYAANNMFGYSSSRMRFYLASNAWLCMHFWQHYLFTRDAAFLRREALPVMASACRFWMQRLVRDSDSTFVCPKELSPEQMQVSPENGVAHAQQLVWDLFRNTLSGIAALGAGAPVTEAFTEELRDKFVHLDNGLHTEAVTSGAYVSSCNGKTFLREWKYTPYSKGLRGHRHLSHLVGLYPGNEISAGGDTAIYRAALVSLTDRGDAATGWSMGWKLNLWARAHNGAHAYLILQKALHLTSNDGLYSDDHGTGGVYANLLDAHPPFQIDGNMGATAGMAEMLLQSQTDTLELLPALPPQWPSGTADGLCAVGGFRVSMEWADGRLVTAHISSPLGGECRLAYPDIGKAELSASAETTETALRTGDDRLTVQTRAGEEFTVKMGMPDLLASVTASPQVRALRSGDCLVVRDGVAEDVALYDTSGRLLGRAHGAALDVASFPSGIYVVRVHLSDGRNVSLKCAW
jgi:alpha-L-fucosidase 2